MFVPYMDDSVFGHLKMSIHFNQYKIVLFVIYFAIRSAYSTDDLFYKSLFKFEVYRLIFKANTVIQNQFG